MEKAGRHSGEALCTGAGEALCTGASGRWMVLKGGWMVLIVKEIKEIAMASSVDFVQYVVDQCGGAGEIVAKKMFGDYGIYCNGKIFGLICDDRFFLKPTEAVRPLLRTVELLPPYDGAKDYFHITDIDDRDYLSGLVRATCEALPEPKKRK